MGWVGAAGEIPQRLLLHSPRSTQVSASPLLQVCHLLCQHHPHLHLRRVQHGRRWEGLSLLRPHLIPKTKPGLCKSIQNLNPFKISIHSKFESVQKFNPFKVELKRLDFIQLASPPLVGSPNSHAQRRVKQRFGKSQLISAVVLNLFSFQVLKLPLFRLGSSRRPRAPT